MQNLETFNTKVNELNDEIKSHYQIYSTDNKKPIYDGLRDIEKYYNSKLRILWILKEAYDIENEGVGDWSIVGEQPEAFLKKAGGARSTWHPIIYTSYCMLNNFELYDNVSFIDDDPSMVNVLNEIAFINVQKFAGNTTSKHGEIRDAYNLHKGILLKQIETYDPHVVICGGTLYHFASDLGLDQSCHHYDEFDYYITNRLYIAAHHPAAPKSHDAKEEYIDDIVRIAKKYFANNGHLRL
ncbi:hypothetical protein I5907_13150 [Panacibacter sp. DH6]|uniref:Uracil-DNA glycosylase n=1 Tax=Panacibacter microcysteis TaxID=2793269 RepID=A0A931EAF3_9BACT|nr:hypothetical protein [Panacibacter microcysteis]MBG9377184.1 hypothetical protein [Panacibacter microcysteis]